LTKHTGEAVTLDACSREGLVLVVGGTLRVFSQSLHESARIMPRLHEDNFPVEEQCADFIPGSFYKYLRSEQVAMRIQTATVQLKQQMFVRIEIWIDNSSKFIIQGRHREQNATENSITFLEIFFLFVSRNTEYYMS
jgi:hypothetical protein